MVNFNFYHLGLDVFAGSVLGSLMYVVEKSIVSTSPLFSVVNGTHLALVSGVLVFAGAIFFKTGSKAYENSEKEMAQINKE